VSGCSVRLFGIDVWKKRIDVWKKRSYVWKRGEWGKVKL